MKELIPTATTKETKKYLFLKLLFDLVDLKIITTTDAVNQIKINERKTNDNN